MTENWTVITEREDERDEPCSWLETFVLAATWLGLAGLSMYVLIYLVAWLAS